MWQSYEKKSWNPSFSHIYIEKEAKKYPKTQEILKKFPKAKVIDIEHYQDVFHPSGQEFFYQKQSQKLILAVKHENFLYPGAKVCESFDHHHFYYTSSVLNCMYDCEYCYLQGVYSSANIVMFVNLEDFFQEVTTLLEAKKQLYLCISYDTDLLALEGITSFVKEWYDFARGKENLMVELRTKSAFFINFEDKEKNRNFIFAWTLSEDAWSQKVEKKTPSLEQRLQAIRRFQEAGFFVRLCFDPVFYSQDFEEKQKTFLEYCFSVIDAKQVFDVSVGTFRVSKEYFKKMRKQNPTSSLLAYPFICEEGVYSYPKEIQEKMFQFLERELQNYVDKEKLYIGGKK